MTHGSLFSGIGGFDLAAQWMGWTNEFHCEINPFGRKVLHHYWPNAMQYHDIKTTDFSIHRGLGILTGGFPCQPYSSAGKRLGKEDDRHLWPEMLRAIREISPRWIVGENVRGLTNWNGGVVFDEVQADLETEGYEVTPFLLPAGSVNAPHRRDRIWFVAHATGDRDNQRGIAYSREDSGGKMWTERTNQLHSLPNGNATYSRHTGLQGRQIIGSPTGSRQNSNQQFAGCVPPTWDQFPTQSPICSRNDGLPRELDGITFPKWRKESIKAYGNAIVPQVVFQIFQAIEQYEITARPGTK